MLFLNNHSSQKPTFLISITLQTQPEQDNIPYASVQFSNNQADPLYSNIRSAQLHRHMEEEEVTEYAAVNFNRGGNAPRWAALHTGTQQQQSYFSFLFVTFAVAFLLFRFTWFIFQFPSQNQRSWNWGRSSCTVQHSQPKMNTSAVSCFFILSWKTMTKYSCTPSRLLLEY